MTYLTILQSTIKIYKASFEKLRDNAKLPNHPSEGLDVPHSTNRVLIDAITVMFHGLTNAIKLGKKKFPFGFLYVLCRFEYTVL